jgi:fumarate hydratase class II
MSTQYRVEQDTMGPVNVPINALYTAQTQRAVENFPFGHPLPKRLLTSMAQLKKACATANNELGLLPTEVMNAIHEAVDLIVNNFDTEQFPISLYQTGSGTSSNMNMNEVISTLASK